MLALSSLGADAGAGAAAGSKGNKTEQSAPLLFSVVLSLPMIVFFVYYLQFQTYV